MLSTVHRSAAFFDLDKTIIARSSTLAAKLTRVVRDRERTEIAGMPGERCSRQASLIVFLLTPWRMAAGAT